MNLHVQVLSFFCIYTVSVTVDCLFPQYILLLQMQTIIAYHSSNSNKCKDIGICIVNFIYSDSRLRSLQIFLTVGELISPLYTAFARALTWLCLQPPVAPPDTIAVQAYGSLDCQRMSDTLLQSDVQ